MFAGIERPNRGSAGSYPTEIRCAEVARLVVERGGVYTDLFSTPARKTVALTEPEKPQRALFSLLTATAANNSPSCRRPTLVGVTETSSAASRGPTQPTHRVAYGEAFIT